MRPTFLQVSRDKHRLHPRRRADLGGTGGGLGAARAWREDFVCGKAQTLVVGVANVYERIVAEGKGCGLTEAREWLVGNLSGGSDGEMEGRWIVDCYNLGDYLVGELSTAVTES